MKVKIYILFFWSFAKEMSMKSDPQNASFGRLRLHEKNYKVIFTKNVILKVRLTLNSKRIYTKLKEHLVRDLKLTRAKTI